MKVMFACCLLSGVLMCSAALCGEAGDVSRPNEVELGDATAPAWQDTTVYASPGNRNEDKGSLFRVKVFRSLPSCRYVKINDQYEGLAEIVPQDGMPWNTGKLTPVSVPDKVRDILELQNDGEAFIKYKKDNTGYFDYSATDPRNYSTLYFEDAGDVFIIQRQQGREAPVLKVRQNLMGFHIHKCALDARNGRIPIVYSYASAGKRIGLVSAETGELTELGPWEDYGFDFCLKWLNDRLIVFTANTRYSSNWGIYDVQARKMLHEFVYNVRDGLPVEQEWYSVCLMKDGRLYVTARNEENGREVLRLFPVSK